MSQPLDAPHAAAAAAAVAAAAVVPPQQTFLGMPPFPTAAKDALVNSQQRTNLAKATHTIRARRQQRVDEVDDWAALRSAGAAVKDRALRHLPVLLERFEVAATAAGARVHWARDAAEANAIIARLVTEREAGHVVKAKSMASEEIGLTEALAAAGVNTFETDLAELIIQLSGDTPSHLVVPAIHRNRSEVRQIFQRNMASFGRPAPENLSDEPQDLTEAARQHLREKFLSAKIAITGANFAVAETGSLVLVESEGNGRMCLTAPQTLISIVGIEKLVPAWRDLEIYLQTLARSATGERMSPYTSTWTGVTPGDGPQDVHIVLLDNGRSRTLADTVGRQTLRCIRCAACLNACPVYERAGGHAYGSVYSGPIGAVLSPHLRGLGDPVDRELPYASSLCGACYEACPVAIDIPSVLEDLRAKVIDTEPEHRRTPGLEKLAMGAASWVLKTPRRLALAERASSLSRHLLAGPDGIDNMPFAGAWFDNRNLPNPPPESFRSWWKRTNGGTTEAGS